MLLTSHTTMASWFMPFCPCWVKIQEDLLFPFVEILLYTEGNCCKLMTRSGNNPLVLFLRGLIGGHNVEFFPPLLQVEKQPPIPSVYYNLIWLNVFTALTAMRGRETFVERHTSLPNRNLAQILRHVNRRTWCSSLYQCVSRSNKRQSAKDY